MFSQSHIVTNAVAHKPHTLMSAPVFVYQMEISGHLFPRVPGTLWMWAGASGTFGACVCVCVWLGLMWADTLQETSQYCQRNRIGSESC